MNTRPSLLNRWAARLFRPARSERPRVGTPSRRSARSAVAWFAVATLALSSAVLVAGDVFAPALRDPEYGRRASRLRDRLREYPTRPLALALGSSRVGGAIAPAEWEALRPSPSSPVLFNMGRAGSGPILQLMTLKRAYADGFRPALVLLEYWPPMMHQPKESTDFARITPDQLLVADLPVVRAYAEGGERERAVWRNRLNPVWGLRRTLMQQIAPDWLPWPKRTENVWASLDAWGWLPGPDVPVVEDARARTRTVAAWAEMYRSQLRSFAISHAPDRALRESIELAREHGAAVGLVYLPESSEFRSWYTPKAERLASEHLGRLAAETNVPVINARDWLTDGYFADGFHLSKLGARELTRKLAPAVVAAFPNLGVQP